MKLSALRGLDKELSRQVQVFSDPQSGETIACDVVYDDEVGASVTFRTWRGDWSFMNPNERISIAEKCVKRIYTITPNGEKKNFVRKSALKALCPKLCISPDWPLLPEEVQVTDSDDLSTIISGMNPVFFMILLNGISQLYDFVEQQREDQKNV